MVYKPKFKNARGEWVEQDVWWFKFRYCGKVVRESSKSTRKTIAQQAEERRRLELEKAYAGIPSEKPKHRVRKLRDALKEYQEGYAVTHRAKSIAWVKERAAHVESALGDALVIDLTETRMAAYMKARKAAGAGNRTANMEVDLVSRAVGNQWRVMWPRLRRLEEPRDVGRALLPEEEQALLVAAGKSRSHTILPFLRIALLTGLRLGEIRNLKWSQVDLERVVLRVGKSKTKAGTGREVPMSDDLLETFREHFKWIESRLGHPAPGWYVFPFSNRVKPVDASRPLTGVKSAWEGVREAAGVECRFHDLRHSAYTKMIEAGVPEGVIMALMGHVSRAMVERYSHVRMAAMRMAVGNLSLQEKKTAGTETPRAEK